MTCEIITERVTETFAPHLTTSHFTTVHLQHAPYQESLYQIALHHIILYIHTCQLAAGECIGGLWLDTKEHIAKIQAQTQLSSDLKVMREVWLGCVAR